MALDIRWRQDEQLTRPRPTNRANWRMTHKEIADHQRKGTKMKKITRSALIKWGTQQQIKWARNEVLRGEPLSHGYRHQLRLEAENVADVVLGQRDVEKLATDREIRAAMGWVAQYPEENAQSLVIAVENYHFRHMTAEAAEAAGFRAGDPDNYRDAQGVIVVEPT